MPLLHRATGIGRSSDDSPQHEQGATTLLSPVAEAIVLRSPTYIGRRAKLYCSARKAILVRGATNIASHLPLRRFAHSPHYSSGNKAIRIHTQSQGRRKRPSHAPTGIVGTLRGFLRYALDPPKGENPHLLPRAPASKPEDLLEIVGFLCGSPGLILIFGL